MIRPTRKLINRTLRFALGAVFLAAGIGKLATMDRASSDDLFKATVGASPAARVIFCITEAALGCWLIVGVLPQISSVASMAMCSAFLGFMAAELRKPAPRECGCFGISKPAATTGEARAGLARSIALNVGMMMAAGELLGSSRRRTVTQGDQDVPAAAEISSLHAS